MSSKAPLPRAQEWATKAKNLVEPWWFLLTLMLALSGVLAGWLTLATPFLRLFAPASLILVIGVTWLLVVPCAWMTLSFTRSVFGWPKKPAKSAAMSASTDAGASAEAPVSLRSWQRKPLDLRTWRRIDPVTLAQAAYLWNDREPPAGTMPGILPDVFPTFQMLLMAVEKRELKAQHAGTPGVATRLARADLAEYASRYGDTPKFLADAD